MFSAALQPGSSIGSFRIERMLGAGGMGLVYRAVGVHGGELVAIKVLRDELALDPTYVRRFEREGDIAATLDHPNLVRVLARGDVEGRPYLVSRYVPGPTLAERVALGPLEPLEVARTVADVGAALDALHRRHLVHRDVKPANVLFDADGHALLSDFGLARSAAHSTLTRAGRIAGTADYLAPELINGSRANAATDIYALGCLAYEALSGAPPFGGRPLAETYIAHLREPPSDLTLIGAPAPFAATLEKALAKEPTRRPATGAAYGRVLRAAAR